MKGRSHAYSLTARDRPGRSALSVAFNDRCDMIVATVVLPHDRPAEIEPGVMEFLNSRNVLHWAEIAVGRTGIQLSVLGFGDGSVDDRSFRELLQFRIRRSPCDHPANARPA